MFSLLANSPWDGLRGNPGEAGRVELAVNRLSLRRDLWDAGRAKPWVRVTVPERLVSLEWVECGESAGLRKSGSARVSRKRQGG